MSRKNFWFDLEKKNKTDFAESFRHGLEDFCNTCINAKGEAV